MQDVNFVKFIEEIMNETQMQFNFEDFILLDCANREQPILDRLKDRIHPLVENGVLERIGRGKGARYLLSKKFYQFINKPGSYTRKKGLDREQNKALLKQHILENPGCKLSELQQVLPAISIRIIQHLLNELKNEGEIKVVGKTRAGRWHLNK